MKCTGRKLTIVLFAFFAAVTLSLSGCGKQSLVRQYPLFGTEDALSTIDALEIKGFTEDLCVTAGDVIPEGMGELQTSAGLFSLDTGETLYANHVFDQMYPASITKVLTALVFFEHYNGDYSEILTASENVKNLEPGSSVCGFAPGDQISLDTVINGMLLNSGNDAAIMIAEYIAGSTDAFCEMMNETARKLGATHSHFVNPHGLSDENHYTTAYDLYLIFQKAMQYDKFVEIINKDKYEGQYKKADGKAKPFSWETTNLYLLGDKETPDNITVIGGKTGTTKAAGYCLILLSKDKENKRYISIVLKANDRTALYQEMSELLKKAGGV